MNGLSDKGVHGYELVGHDCIACASGAPHSRLLHRYYLSECRRLGHPDKVGFVTESDSILGLHILKLSIIWTCLIVLAVLLYRGALPGGQSAFLWVHAGGLLVGNVFWTGMTVYEYFHKPAALLARGRG